MWTAWPEQLASDDLEIRAAKNVHRRMGETLETIARRRDKLAEDRYISDLARSERLRAHVAEVAGEPLSKAEDVLRQLNQAQANARSAWKRKVDAPAEDPRSLQAETEFRAMLRSMPEQERSRTILEAADRGDGFTLHAALNVPRPELIDATPAEYDFLQAETLRRLAPEALEKAEKARLAAVHLDLAARRFAGEVAQFGLSTPSWTREAGVEGLGTPPELIEEAAE